MSKNIRSLTLRIPEPIHHKLRVIAALQNTTMTGAICYLVEKETLHDMEQSEVIESLLHKAASRAGKADQEKRKVKKRKPEVDI